MDQKLRGGGVIFGLLAFVLCGLLGIDLFLDAETVLAGARTEVTVVSVGETGHVVSFTWEGRAREATTEWLPGRARRGTVISALVNRRDPGFVLVNETASLRYRRYARDVLLIGGSALAGVGFLWWGYREAPPTDREKPRFTQPNRAERRARRRR